MEPRSVGIERPEAYSDEEWEAYKAGASAMMRFCGQMLMSMGADIEGQVADGSAGTAPTGEEEDDDHPEECPDCGMDLVYQMGQEDGKCPNCDLL